MKVAVFEAAEAAARTRAGDFWMEGLRGFDLAGRTRGVVGAGRIGSRVIQIARGFGMTAIATDSALPQLNGDLFLTDGGLETTLIFHEGVELPDFAAFVLLRNADGRATLKRYFETYLEIAETEGRGFILESPTWRASTDWAARLGMSRDELAGLNRDAVGMMRELRDAWRGRVDPIVVSGCVGPRGHGYDPGQVMTAEEAEAYHAEQIAAFAQAGADMAAPSP